MKPAYLFCPCVKANNFVRLISKFIDEPTCDKQIGACQNCQRRMTPCAGMNKIIKIGTVSFDLPSVVAT